MSPWIRRIGIALAVLLLLAGGAAVWLATGFDANRYKGAAIDWMKANRNRTLAIDAPIELSVFPRLAVRLGKVSLSEAGRDEVFVAVERAALAVELLPLLRGRLVVDRVEAAGVAVAVTRDAQGRRNIDDLVQPARAASAPAAGAPSSRSAGSLSFDVSRIELADVRARVRDAVAGIDGEIVLKKLSTGRIADGVETPVELAAALALKAPALEAELAGTARVSPDLGSGAVRLAALDLTFGASSAGLTLADSTLALERFGYDPGRRALTLDKLVLRLKGRRGADALALELDWPQLAVVGDTLRGSPFSGKFTLGGALPLEADFRSGAPTGTFDALALPGLEARLSSAGKSRKLAGSLRSHLAIKPAQAQVTLGAIELQANVEEPGLAAVALTARGQASASPKAASASLAGQANANAFRIDASANLAAKPPAIKVQANFDALDLNTLLPAAAPPGAAPGAPTSAPADTPIDLAPLRSVDAVLGLRAGRFAFRQYRVADAKLDATLAGGLLRVTTLQGQAWGGQFDAAASADARSQRMAVKATASGVNVAALLKDVAAKDLLEGTGRVTLDVDSAGRSVAELRRKLAGSAALQLRDGAIKGVNLAKSLRQAKAALAMRSDTSQKASQTEKTDFSELSASLRIADGVARSSDLDMKSPFLRLGGDGAIDIGRGMIDYTARATVTSTATGQDGAELAALKGLTVPVRLTGPFEAIDWKIQWSAVAAGMAKNQLEDKLKDKLGLKPPAGGASAPAPRPKDVLKEKLLKGLLK